MADAMSEDDTTTWVDDDDDNIEHTANGVNTLDESRYITPFVGSLEESPLYSKLLNTERFTPLPLYDSTIRGATPDSRNTLYNNNHVNRDEGDDTDVDPPHELVPLTGTIPMTGIPHTIWRKRLDGYMSQREFFISEWAKQMPTFRRVVTDERDYLQYDSWTERVLENQPDPTCEFGLFGVYRNPLRAAASMLHEVDPIGEEQMLLYYLSMVMLSFWLHVNNRYFQQVGSPDRPIRHPKPDSSVLEVDTHYSHLLPEYVFAVVDKLDFLKEYTLDPALGYDTRFTSITAAWTFASHSSFHRFERVCMYSLRDQARTSGNDVLLSQLTKLDQWENNTMQKSFRKIIESIGHKQIPISVPVLSTNVTVHYQSNCYDRLDHLGNAIKRYLVVRAGTGNSSCFTARTATMPSSLAGVAVGIIRNGFSASAARNNKHKKKPLSKSPKKKKKTDTKKDAKTTTETKKKKKKKTTTKSKAAKVTRLTRKRKAEADADTEDDVAVADAEKDEEEGRVSSTEAASEAPIESDEVKPKQKRGRKSKQTQADEESDYDFSTPALRIPDLWTNLVFQPLTPLVVIPLQDREAFEHDEECFKPNPDFDETIADDEVLSKLDVDDRCETIRELLSRQNRMMNQFAMLLCDKLIEKCATQLRANYSRFCHRNPAVAAKLESKEVDKTRKFWLDQRSTVQLTPLVRRYTFTIKKAELFYSVNPIDIRGLDSPSFLTFGAFWYGVRCGVNRFDSTTRWIQSAVIRRTLDDDDDASYDCIPLTGVASSSSSSSSSTSTSATVIYLNQCVASKLNTHEKQYLADFPLYLTQQVEGLVYELYCALKIVLDDENDVFATMAEVYSIGVFGSKRFDIITTDADHESVALELFQRLQTESMRHEVELVTFFRKLSEQRKPSIVETIKEMVAAESSDSVEASVLQFFRKHFKHVLAAVVFIAITRFAELNAQRYTSSTLSPALASQLYRMKVLKDKRSADVVQKKLFATDPTVASPQLKQLLTHRVEMLQFVSASVHETIWPLMRRVWIQFTRHVVVVPPVVTDECIRDRDQKDKKPQLRKLNAYIKKKLHTQTVQKEIHEISEHPDVPIADDIRTALRALYVVCSRAETGPDFMDFEEAERLRELSASSSHMLDATYDLEASQIAVEVCRDIAQSKWITFRTMRRLTRLVDADLQQRRIPNDSDRDSLMYYLELLRSSLQYDGFVRGLERINVLYTEAFSRGSGSELASWLYFEGAKRFLSERIGPNRNTAVDETSNSVASSTDSHHIDMLLEVVGQQSNILDD